jgi:hypothetical protein
MFAKSTQIGLVSLFVVLTAAIGGCAESVGNEPASFPSEHRSVAFATRAPLPPQLSDERLPQIAKVEPLAAHTDSKHLAHPVANLH